MTSLHTIALGVAIAAVASADASAQESDVADQTRSPSFFFVQSGKSLEVTRETMTLVDARGKTTSVTDRPERIVDQISNETFAARWDEGPDSFADDPPNAVVTVAGHRPVIVVLTDIMVSPDRISYDYELLDGRFPYHSAPTTIVIDDASAPSSGTIIYLADPAIGSGEPGNAAAYRRACQNYAAPNMWNYCEYANVSDPGLYIECICY